MRVEDHRPSGTAPFPPTPCSRRGIHSSANSKSANSKSGLAVQAFHVDFTNILVACASLPALCAFWIMASRVVDNEHSPADVTCGAIIGMSFSVLCFGRYFGGELSARVPAPTPVVLKSAHSIAVVDSHQGAPEPADESDGLTATIAPASLAKVVP